MSFYLCVNTIIYGIQLWWFNKKDCKIRRDLKVGLFFFTAFLDFLKTLNWTFSSFLVVGAQFNVYRKIKPQLTDWVNDNLDFSQRNFHQTSIEKTKTSTEPFFQFCNLILPQTPMPSGIKFQQLKALPFNYAMKVIKTKNRIPTVIRLFCRR